MISRRILHVVGFIDPAAGGVSEAIRSLIEYGPKGYEHEVVTVDDPSRAFLATLPFRVHALGPYGVLEYSPRLLPWLLQNRHRFDGVFIHGLWVYCGYAAWRAFAGRIPYVVFTHGMLDPYFKRAFPLKHLKKWAFWIAAEYWILRGAYKVLFTCDAEERLAKQSFRLHRWNPFVVAFGATGPEGDPEVQRRAFLLRCPQVQGRRFLLFLGRIHRKKGCDLLIEAFARAAELDPALDLVMAGPDQQNWQSELTATVAESGLAGRVHWTGMLQGGAKWGAFFGCEAFILPSHQENFGIAVAEALACGRPVLLSDKVNIAADIDADGAGLMESDTTDGTLRLLERWIAMGPAEREGMSIQARRTFLARYDMRSNARAIVRVFEPLFGKTHYTRSMAKQAHYNARDHISPDTAVDPYLRPAFSTGNRLRRLLWNLCWLLLYRWSPRPLHGWRSFLLRRFGAVLGPDCHFYPKSKVWAPWNLTCADQVTAADGAEIYNPAPMRFGSHAILSQEAYVCGATHDFDDPAFPLLAYSMEMGAHAWVCARASVAPGVNVGEGAVLGLGSVATRDLEAWTVYAGVPAVRIKERRRTL